MRISIRFQIPTKLLLMERLKISGDFVLLQIRLKIEKQDYILTPDAMLGIEEQEDDDEPFEEKDGSVNI